VLKEKDRLDEIAGLRKTDRGNRMAQPGLGGRVHMIIQSSPPSAAGGPVPPQADPAAKPAEPLVALPFNIAARRAE
jgi:hypothetical protein